MVQLIPGQAVRDALEFDEEEHERLHHVAISMRKTVLLLTMAERGLDASEALRIASNVPFKRKADKAKEVLPQAEDSGRSADTAASPCWPCRFGCTKFAVPVHVSVS